MKRSNGASRQRFSQSVNVDKRYDGCIAPILRKTISVVVPVKNNQSGVERLLDSILDRGETAGPLEIIVVDNNSLEPVRILDRHLDGGTPVRLLTCAKPGAAAARNVGAAAARGEWILFADSDCIPTSSFITGYCSADGRSIAYAGNVQGTPDNRLVRFYDTERTLLPRLKINAAGEEAPLYIVTANALVWKQTFDLCGGFDEGFDGAGGEDVELSLRLWKIGSIGSAPKSLVLHDFSDGVLGLWRRYSRYGRGNRTLEVVAGIGMRPRWGASTYRGLTNLLFKLIKHAALCYGYYYPSRMAKGVEGRIGQRSWQQADGHPR
jgi:glycosyltransferase involved in cell wall biosynthesis